MVAGYGSDDEAISQEGSQVDAQEEPEVQELQLPGICEHQEEELIEGTAIEHFFTLHRGTVERQQDIDTLGQTSLTQSYAVSQKYPLTLSSLSQGDLHSAPFCDLRCVLLSVS